ncbi:MAG: hypothetical protein KJ858_03990 [Nanoarchaeota archaeon]|nr:hypothetical protein [Nanoarchaeota archaeon]
MKNKKAISLMVSYALLVVIAVAMGAIIYPFLKSYIFSEKAECQQDISLTINRVWCNSTTTRITVELFNSGLFNIDGAFVRFSNESRVVRPQLNPRNETFSQGALEPSSSRTDTF